MMGHSKIQERSIRRKQQQPPFIKQTFNNDGLPLIVNKGRHDGGGGDDRQQNRDKRLHLPRAKA